MGISLHDATVLGFLQTVGAMESVLQRGLTYCIPAPSAFGHPAQHRAVGR